ncbi:hypothetical protein SUGI_0546700 [Cryptomeria japonica]|nr:hypothetical protein SUGI_0546700 [Cryptomeria japonica]
MRTTDVTGKVSAIMNDKDKDVKVGGSKSLVADACIQAFPKNPASFNMENVRDSKLLKGGLHDCGIFLGTLLESDAIGTIKHVVRVRIAVFNRSVISYIN